MDDIYICSPGEYVVLSNQPSSKNKLGNGLLCQVKGIHNGKIRCESITSDGSNGHIFNVDPSEIIDCGEFHNDREGDDNEDDDDDNTIDSDSSFLTPLAIFGHTRKYSLLARAKQMVDALDMNENALDTSEVISAIEYLKRQLTTCKSFPLFVIGNYFLVNFLSCTTQYVEAIAVCSNLISSTASTNTNTSLNTYLSFSDKCRLLLLLARLYNKNNEPLQEIETLRQYLLLQPQDVHVACLYLKATSKVATGSYCSSTNVGQYEELANRDPHCVFNLFQLIQCYYALGDSRYAQVLLKCTEPMRLQENTQTKEEAIKLHIDIARLIITSGIDLKCAIVPLLRAIHIGRSESTAPKSFIVLETSRSVLYSACELLGELFERLGQVTAKANCFAGGYFQSAYVLYDLCFNAVCKDGSEQQLDYFRAAKERVKIT